jgi:hypothetical protein
MKGLADGGNVERIPNIKFVFISTVCFVTYLITAVQNY